MRRFFTLLCLFASVITNAFGQPENDLCATAIPIDMGQVINCPDDAPFETGLSGTTLAATPTEPALRLSHPAQGLVFNSSSADVWYTFTATANQTIVSITGGLEQPVLVLFEGNACNATFPVALQSGAPGTLGTTLSARTEPGSQYYLLVSTGDFGAEGSFSLKIKSQNDCSICGERRGQLTATPAPVNGTYETGQEVTFCYTPTRWAPGFSLEWLHGLDIDFGPGWDLTTLETTAPTACTAPDGNWGWYENWESCNTNDTFGPGFAFDSKRGLLCPGATAHDGLPGNNFGDGPCGNLEPAALDLEFCWTVRVKSTFNSTEEANLNLDIMMLGDGASGSWMMASCAPATTSTFLATAVPPASAQPGVTVVQPACPALCNGRLSVSGGNSSNVTLLGPDGQPVFSGAGPIVNTLISDLCPGTYQFVIEAGGNEQALSVEVPATDLPDVSATFLPACFADDPYQLQANVGGNASGLTYNWSGPDSFASNLQNPTVLQTGTYLLESFFNNCPVPAVEVEVQNTLPEIHCSTTENSIVFSWAAQAADTAYLPNLLTGQAGQMAGNLSFVVDNLAPGETATLELAIEGQGDCPLKVVEKTCVTNSCPQPDAGPDTLLCSAAGIALTIEAEADAVVSWVPATGLDCTDCPNPVATPSQTITYEVTVTNAQGCTGVDAVTIYVDEIPGDVIPDEPLAFCPGEAFSFCLPDANQYLWISPIGFIQTGNCLTFPYTSPSVAGEYALRVKLPNGCRVSETITLSADPACHSFSAPGATTGQQAPMDRLQVFPNPARTAVQLRTTLEGHKIFQLWSVDGRSVARQENAEMSVTFDLEGMASGTYVVEMTGAGGTERKLLSVQ
jgi:hypothetical protein